MAYQVKDLASYVPKYTPLQGRSDQEVYDFSINPQTNAADQANATGELRRRNLMGAPPVPQFDIPQASPYTGAAMDPVPVMPWSREGVIRSANAGDPDITANRTSVFARSLGQSVLGNNFSDPLARGGIMARPATTQTNLPGAGYTALPNQKARTVRQYAENLVGGILQRFSRVPLKRLSANRGLQTAYASHEPGDPYRTSPNTLGQLGGWGAAGIFPDPDSYAPLGNGRDIISRPGNTRTDDLRYSNGLTTWSGAGRKRPTLI